MKQVNISNIKYHITLFTQNIKSSKYKLQKDIQKNIYRVINKYKILEKIFQSNDINNEIVNIFNECANKLLITFPEDYLTLFNKNISNVNIKNHLEIGEMAYNILYAIRNLGASKGYYRGIENTIYLSSKFENSILVFLTNDENKSYREIIKEVLSHEIFHVASYKCVDGIEYSGFSKYSSQINLDFGDTLNEGYTELLSRRYFNKEEGYYNKEVIIASYIEKLIEPKKMAEMYFKADLNSLVDAISLYSDKEKTIEFITNIDNYGKDHNEESKNKIIEFLTTSYRNKLLADKYLTIDEINNLSHTYYNNLYMQLDENNPNNKIKSHY